MVLGVRMQEGWKKLSSLKENADQQGGILMAKQPKIPIKNSMLGPHPARGPSRNSTPPIRSLTQAQMNERIEKGLCYNCDEKYVPGHRCKQRQLFLLEETSDQEEEPQQPEPEEDRGQEAGSLGEALFSPLLRKIQGLGPSFISKVQNIKGSLLSSTAALYTAKAMEKHVRDDIAQTIIKIDDLIENYKKITPQQTGNDYEKKVNEIIKAGLKQIQVHMAGDPKFEEENIDSKQEFLLDHWLTEAKKNLEGEFTTDIHLRYNLLPPTLQNCLLFFSVFPKDAVIKKRPMIYWWIAEGLVKPTKYETEEKVREERLKITKYETAEQVGEEYFKMLLVSGLILPISKKHDTTARCCKLHSGVREMIISIATAAHRFKFDWQKENDLAYGECPVSCMNATEDKHSIAVSLGSKSNELLSLFNVSTQYLKCDQEKFSGLKSIVALPLGRWQASASHHIEIKDTKFLDNLKVMKNLKYLSLKGISTIVKLPNSLSHLTNLQILDLQACHDLETLPAAVVSLKKLTHLDVSGCSLLDRMPKGLGSLSELQVLKGFIISHDRIKDPCHLQDLDRLKKLRKLSINIASEAEANVHLNVLKNFKSLRSLTIAWGRITSADKSPLNISLADLEKLDLQCVPPHEKLDWLQPGREDESRPQPQPPGFKNLKKLYIRGGRMKDLNLGTGSTWKVETLRLKNLCELECVEIAFPSLACIEIYDCPKLKIKNKSLAPYPPYRPDEARIWKENVEEASTIDMPSSSTVAEAT